MADKESYAPKLVEPQAAAQRLVCLMVISARGYFEDLLSDCEPESVVATQDIENLMLWLREERLWPSLSKKETTILELTPGMWSKKDRVNTSWRVEAAGVIAWTLGLVEMPAYDKQFRSHGIMDVLPEPHTSTQEWVCGAALQPEEQILASRDVAELWLWRARTTRLQKDGRKPGVKGTYEEFIAGAAEAGERDSLFKRHSGDFPAFGKAYRDLSENEWHTMTSIATERLYGLNWVCGYGSDWDEVSPDT
jgi:hypothetical protein